MKKGEHGDNEISTSLHLAIPNFERRPLGICKAIFCANLHPGPSTHSLGRHRITYGGLESNAISGGYVRANNG